jgi:hypothetical protein
MKKIILLITLFCVGTACREDTSELSRHLQETAINDILLNSFEFDVPQDTLIESEADREDPTASDGKKFTCDVRRIQRVDVLENLTLSAFDDLAATNTAGLYPGAIIKLKDLRDLGDINTIGGFERAPLEVSSTLGDIRTVDDPSQRGNVDKAIREMEQDQGDFAANVKFKVTEAYSLEQAMLQLGIDAKYLGNSVRSDLKIENSVEERSVFIQFYQVYHTVSIANPASPAEFFGNSVRAEQLSEATTEDNPLGYISEVAYGRMLVGRYTYRGTDFSADASLEVEVRKGLAKITGESDASYDQRIENATFEVAILGGSAQEADNVSGGAGMATVQKAYDFIRNGGSDPSLGVPVQYKVRYLASNNLFRIGGAAEYDVSDCQRVPRGVNITKFTLKSADTSSDWDFGIGNAQRPDVFFTIRQGNKITAEYQNEQFGNLQSSDLPKDWKKENGRLITHEVNNLSQSFKLEFHDADDGLTIDKDGEFGGTDKMQTISINWNSYGPRSANPTPGSITVNGGSFSMTLRLEWKY